MVAQLKFRGFLETVEEKFHSMKADIPHPAAVYTLSELFARQGASLFAVGGVIRDFLYSHHHGGKFSPKDVDLATEAPPEKVMAILGSPAALSHGIKTFPKGEASELFLPLLTEKNTRSPPSEKTVNTPMGGVLTP